MKTTERIVTRAPQGRSRTQCALFGSRPECCRVSALTAPRRFIPTYPLRSAISSRGLIYGGILVLMPGFGIFYLTDTRSRCHRFITVPLWQAVYNEAEDAHEAGIGIVRGLYNLGLHPRERHEPSNEPVEVLGQVLANPVAISAGLDKGAELIDPLFAMGPALLEVGGVTPQPQEGSVRPRAWRLPSQNAIINRYGLNSEGADRVARRLQNRLREYAKSIGLGYGEEAEKMILNGEAGVPPGSLLSGRLLAVQIAKNKATPEQDLEAVKRDYIYCVERLAKYADIITVNVSSPNTPGLRSLQKTEPLTNLLTGIVAATRSIDRKTKPAVMVKVSPDEDSNADIRGVCEAVWRSGVDGVIVGNTTKLRPELTQQPEREVEILQQAGGYSGPLTFERTLDLIMRYRNVLDGPKRSANGKKDKVPKVIFASGGISGGDDAVAALQAGASVAMVYTAMMYEGAGFITRIKVEMRELASRPVSSLPEG